MSEAEQFIDSSRKQGSSARTVLLIVAIIVGVLIFFGLIDSGFGRWGGGGSVLLFGAVAIAVVYLLNRRPSGARTPLPPPTSAPMTAEEAAQYAGSVPTTTTDLPPPAPAGFAYGGPGSYPGYVYTAPAPKLPKQRSYLGLLTLSLALAATGILGAISATGNADIPFVLISSVALGILGLGLLVGAFVGRARWLVFLAVPLLMVTALAALVPADLSHRLGKGVGERVWTPTAVATLASAYELGVGRATLDLTQLNATVTNPPISVSASVGAGNLTVFVPQNARVFVNAHVSTGQLTLNGAKFLGGGTYDQRNGRNLSYLDNLAGGTTNGPIINLDVRVNVGNLEVSRA
jgi:hypothetical protein